MRKGLWIFQHHSPEQIDGFHLSYRKVASIYPNIQTHRIYATASRLSRAAEVTPSEYIPLVDQGKRRVVGGRAAPQKGWDYERPPSFQV